MIIHNLRNSAPPQNYTVSETNLKSRRQNGRKKGLETHKRYRMQRGIKSKEWITCLTIVCFFFKWIEKERAEEMIKWNEVLYVIGDCGENLPNPEGTRRCSFNEYAYDMAEFEKWFFAFSDKHVQEFWHTHLSVVVH